MFSIPKKKKFVNSPKKLFHSSEQNDDGLKNINFTVEDIEEAIKKLKYNTASTLDSIPLFLLKIYRQELASTFFYFF